MRVNGFLTIDIILNNSANHEFAWTFHTTVNYNGIFINIEGYYTHRSPWSVVGNRSSCVGRVKFGEFVEKAFCVGCWWLNNLLCVSKMNTVPSKSNVKSEFMEIDSIGGWPQLYQVWNCVLSFGIERGLIQVQGQGIVFLNVAKRYL